MEYWNEVECEQNSCRMRSKWFRYEIKMESEWEQNWQPKCFRNEYKMDRERDERERGELRRFKTSLHSSRTVLDSPSQHSLRSHRVLFPVAKWLMMMMTDVSECMMRCMRLVGMRWLFDCVQAILGSDCSTHWRVRDKWMIEMKGNVMSDWLEHAVARYRQTNELWNGWDEEEDVLEWWDVMQWLEGDDCLIVWRAIERK